MQHQPPTQVDPAAGLWSHRGSERGTLRAAWWPWLEWAAILAVFALHGAWSGPAVNEPYYLGKARHYWQPEWAAGDFFLETADAHTVFYLTFGWLARWLPLLAMAWTGRWITWALLAWAWRRLSAALTPAPGAAVLSAGLLVFLVDRTNLAGEWVIGGVEAKGFAYVLVLLALEQVIRGRWNAGWLALGAASAFHVLVGGWFALTLGAAWLVLRLRGLWRPHVAAAAGVPPLRAMLPGLAAAMPLALLGLAPSLALNWGLDRAVIDDGNDWYLYRLWHHLDGWEIIAKSPWIGVRFGLVVAAWLAVSLLWLIGAGADDDRGSPQMPPGVLVWAVYASIAAAVVGLGICAVRPWYPELGNALLRYYWFRCSDVAVPMGVALGATALVFRGLANLRPYAWLGLAALGSLAALQVCDDVLLRAEGTPQFEEDFADQWWEACQWLNASAIPRDARFITPRLAQTFKWHTGRPEIMNWKEIPQNASAIVEWARRIEEFYMGDTTPGSSGWYHCLAERDPGELRELARRYQAEYLFTYSVPRLPFAVMYRNEIYTIYRIGEAEGRRGQ